MKKFTYTILISIGLLFGCQNLETQLQVNQIAGETFLVSEQQIFEALIAAYDPLGWEMHGGFWISPIMFGEIRSDNANAGGDNTNADQPGWQELDDFLNTTFTNETQWIWDKCYKGINRANNVINNAKVENAEVTRMQAEAHFLRAWYHFDLFRHYGPVPVITRALAPSETNVSRNTMTEVFEQIEEDLLFAVNNLPSSYSAGFEGRVTRGVAQALLGKAYLYWADMAGDDVALFDKAADQLQDVYDLGIYQLEDDYKDIFGFNNKNSTESIFEIQHTNQFPSGWNMPNSMIEGNPVVQLCGIRGLCSRHPDYEEGWGFLMPTQELVDSYLIDDGYRLDGSIITEQELEDAIDGNGGAGPCGGKYFGGADEHNPLDFEGLWQEKYANFIAYTSSDGDVNLTKDANTVIIRFADVILMLAEALHRGSGSDATAMTLIDEVRERAFGPGDNTGIYRTTVTVMAEEGWSLLDVIWYERRAEFAMEGDRWYDLVRSGRASATLFTGDPIRGQNFTSDDLWIPISQREIDLTGGALDPYPSSTLFE